MPRGRPPKPRAGDGSQSDGVLTTNADNNSFSSHGSSYKCDICLFSFPKETQYQKHMRDHEKNDKPHRCDQCPMSFNIEFNLTLHKSTHNVDDPACPACNKKFSRVASLKAHIMLHEKEETLICSECGDEFTLQSHLSLHMEEHRQEVTGNKTYSCKSCKKTFETAPQLKDHMKTHFKIRVSSTRSYNRNIDRSGFSYSCPHCGKTFQKPSQLTRHIRIHTGERPFKCNLCGKAFNQKGALATHMVKHTGEKPHACAFCPAAFSQKGNLQSHIQRVHSEVKNGVTYNCTDCSCVFKSLGSLNTHISKMHVLGSQTTPTSTEAPNHVNMDTSQPPAIPDASLLQQSPDDKWKNTVVFRPVPGQTDTASSSIPQQGQQPAVTDVIQQLLELSEPVPVENSQTQQAGQPLNIAVGINRDILQQALENSGLSSIPVAPLPSDTSQTKTADQEIECLSSQQMDCNDQEPGVDQEDQDKTEKSEKRIFKKKSTLTPVSGSVREESGVRWHVCTYCAKEFKKPSDLVRHIRIHTHEKPFKCLQCFRAFAVKSTLTAHIKTHTGIKAFKCDFCMKCFSTSGSLKVHIRLHTGVRPFACPHCEKKFRTSGHRKTHIASHFKQCELRKLRQQRKPGKLRTGKGNVSMAEIPLQEPILITDLGLIQPIPRNSQFFQNYFINSYTHEVDRPYKCYYCQRAYKKSCHLKQHIRSHTGEKPFKCTQCGRGFASSGVLKAHVRTHTGLRSHKCPICNGTFTTGGSLRRHMGIHNDFRPYMCPYCQKTFKTSLNCKKHMKTHRYEVAHQLQQHQPTSSEETPVDQIHVSNQIQVEIEGASLHQQTSVATQQEAILQLSPQPDMDTVSPALEQTLAEQPLQAEEGVRTFSDRFVTSQHALQENIGQYEPQVLPPQPYDQQGLQQGFTVTDGFSQQTSFPAVQQLQDSSTLESQALSTSYQQPTLMEVPTTDTINVTARLIQEETQEEIELQTQRTPFLESTEDQSRRAYRCEYCNKGFKKSSHLKQHVRSHTGEKPYKCSMCGRGFVSSGVLKSHEKTHTGVKAYSCTICNAAFTTNGSLTRHMSTHISMKPYKCPFCDETFRTTVHCKKHMKKHQNIPPNLVSDSDGTTREEGDVCLEEEEENTDRLASRKSRHGVITFTEEETAELAKIRPREGATISEKVLVQSAAEKDRISEIKDKQAEMETEPKFANCCTFCPKSFKKPSDLIRHIRIHTGEKPFKCEECGKSFTVKSTLDSHVKTHGGQKLFNCHVCTNSFSTKGSLKVHMRLHTGAKPFKCPHCDMRFRTSGRRKTHIQCHYKSDAKKVRKPVMRRHLPQTTVSAPNTTSSTVESLQPINLLNTSATDPSVFITNSSVLSSQFDQNLLQQGLVGQAILPASVSAAGDLTVSLSDCSLATLEGIQLQLAANLVGQNVQISGIDATSINNITLQIDPSLLQQTLHHSSMLPQALPGDSGAVQATNTLQTSDNAMPANVVLQPIASLSLQPGTTSSSNLTITPISEQESVLTSSSASGHELSQVMASQGLVSSSNGQHEITLTINNSSLSQVLAHAAGNTPTTSSVSPQEITLTISGQDIMQLGTSGGTELSGNLRLSTPAITNQTPGTSLSLSNDHILSQANTLTTTSELTTSTGSLTSTTSIIQTPVSTQNLVMSSGVGGDGSVTLTLADTESMLSGSLDGVTLNITPQSQQFSGILSDNSLSGQSGPGSQQVILVSHGGQPSNNTSDLRYQVTDEARIDKGSDADKQDRIHQCFECNHYFSSASMLADHNKEAHGKEKIHVCHLCNKAFKRASHLKDHMQTHQPGPSRNSQLPKLFKCDTCEKGFAKPSQLERHSRIHTGERPFQCTLCEKAFNQKSALQVHMKKHTGEKPYKCDYCSMTFSQKCNMKLHMKRTHSYPDLIEEVSLHPEEEDGGEDITHTLDLEEVVQESSGEWQCGITNVFR